MGITYELDLRSLGHIGLGFYRQRYRINTSVVAVELAHAHTV